MTNTPAYNDVELITAVKRFIVQPAEVSLLSKISIQKCFSLNQNLTMMFLFLIEGGAFNETVSIERKK